MAQWKDVPRYEGLYLVSDEGQIISLSKKIKTRNKYGNIEVTRKAKFIKPHLRGRELKYVAVTLTKNGKSKAHSLHRIVAEAFIPNPDNLEEVNHKDENPKNNCVENLEWCTHQYNIEYSKSKRIAQFKNGNKIAEHKSIAYASKLTGISRRAINNCLKGWSKSAGGYCWKYL